MTLPITTLEYKDLIAKARTLKEQLDNDNLDKSFLKEFIEFTLKTAPKDFDTTKLTKDDIKKSFIQFLEKEFPNKKYEHYWDYRDDLSSNDLEKILNLANTEKAKSFVQATQWYLFQECPELETEDIDYVISEFYKTCREKVDEIKDILDWEEYSFLSDIFYDTIDYDLDVETLLSHSAPEDLTVYFGETWDDTYADIEYDFIEIFDKPEFLTNERNTPIDWLMQTQGYTRENLVSEETREKSVFLTTLYEELFDYMNGLEGCQLIAIPDSDDFEAILNLTRRKNVKINKGTNFGFFNRIHGSGCGLSIELEKDIIINETSPIHEVTLKTYNNSWDYSPNAVYGLAHKFRGNDLTIVKNESEEN
jgi:hypothetical protein